MGVVLVFFRDLGVYSAMHSAPFLVSDIVLKNGAIFDSCHGNWVVVVLKQGPGPCGTNQ